MDWNKLKEMKCPKCSGNLQDSTMGYICTKGSCEFRISYDRFRDVANSVYVGKRNKPSRTYVPQYTTEEESLAALNNL